MVKQGIFGKINMEFGLKSINSPTIANAIIGRVKKVKELYLLSYLRGVEFCLDVML